MNKFITLTLSLIMALTFAAPALAFTDMDKTEAVETQWDVNVQLVDYTAASFAKGYYTSLPSVDRGYLKNEMVGALVTLYVPNDAKDSQAEFSLETEDVHVWGFIAEDEDLEGKLIDTDMVVDGDNAPIIASVGDDRSYRYLVLGQLIAEKGSITARVSDTTDSASIPDEGVNIDGYLVTKSGYDYILTMDNDVIRITVDRDNFCEEMYITPDGMAEANVHSYRSDEVAYETDAAFLRDDDSEYDDYHDIYLDVKDAFGFDINDEGYLYDSFFYGVKGSIEVSDTVYLEPFVPTLTVPTPPAVEPPKTGDAGSALGIAFMALASLGLVAMKRRKAHLG